MLRHFAQRHQLYRDGIPIDDQLGSRDRQAEPPPAGAARIHVQHAIALAARGLVRVAGHDDPDAGRARVDVELLQVMDRVQGHGADVDAGAFRNRARPRCRVVVPADDRERGNGREALEDLRAADIAAVDDVVGPGEEIERLGPEQAGREADDDIHDAAGRAARTEQRGDDVDVEQAHHRPVQAADDQERHCGVVDPGHRGRPFAHGSASFGQVPAFHRRCVHGCHHVLLCKGW
ncbi:conserved hypothetical protein [Ricinus communis]|uniref:Uncharacterized protein n=1 Tax=Ricinus communis TaxID=3988 RepID=B9TFU6_RICCO|nr:conserved hypothetical protein [Ricinus communis]